MFLGYINFFIGIEWKLKLWFNVYILLVVGKIMIVWDDLLVNVGVFGVDLVIYNVNGEMVVVGKYICYEFGVYFCVQFEKEIVKNIQMKIWVELFSNYLYDFGNIDINVENIFIFKVNNWFFFFL